MATETTAKRTGFPIFDADDMPHFPCGDHCCMCVDGGPICYDCGTPWPCDPVRAMTVRLRVTVECVAGNDGHDGAEIVVFHEGMEFDGYLMGGHWWTSTDMREAFAVPESNVLVVGPAATS